MKIRVVSGKYSPENAIDKNLFWPELKENRPIFPFNQDVLVERGFLLAVTHSSGPRLIASEACKFCLEKLAEAYYQSKSFSTVQVNLKKSFQKVNRIMYEYTHQDKFKSPIIGNTLVAAVIKKNQLTLANIGDTAAFLIRNRTIQELVPLKEPETSEKLPLFSSFLGGLIDDLVVRTKDTKPIPIAKMYLDFTGPLTVERGDILILINDRVIMPGRMGVTQIEVLMDQVKNNNLMEWLHEAFLYSSLYQYFTLTMTAIEFYD